MPRIPTPEAGVLKACLDILTAHRIWHERRNTGGMRQGTRFIKFSRKGTADILASVQKRHVECWWRPFFLWIECKAAKGKQSAEQVYFQAEVEAAEHHYLIVRKPEDLLTWLREHGVIKA